MTLLLQLFIKNEPHPIKHSKTYLLLYGWDMGVSGTFTNGELEHSCF